MTDRNTLAADDVLVAKAASIERCLRRITEELAADPGLSDFTHQDAAVLNLERACQAAIDMAMRVVRLRRLGTPTASGQAFGLLARAGIIDTRLAASMKSMVGFRNVAVHEYRELDPAVVAWAASTGTRDFIAFCAALGLAIRP